MHEIVLFIVAGSFRSALESITKCLKSCALNQVRHLTVRFEPELNKPSKKSDPRYLKLMSSFLPLCYNKASSLCQGTEVRVILSNSKKRKADCKRNSQYDIVYSNAADDNILYSYLDDHLYLESIVAHSYKDFTPCEDLNNDASLKFETYRTVCLGGTFDHLHNGHKVLLSEAALRATEKLIVGVTDGPMLKRKTLWELIEPIQKRIANVTEFLLDVDPSLHYEVLPITDPYGPTITDPDIDCIVVSSETMKGGEKVNVERKKKGMSELAMHVVDLVENSEKLPGEEDKMSSSTKRMHILGTLIRKYKLRWSKYYTIILRGQPQTGKTCISTSMQKLGAVIISCSDIIPDVITNNPDIRASFLQKFTNAIFKPNGSLDYKALITLCLNDKERRLWVADKLWEKVLEEVEERVENYREENYMEDEQFFIVKDSILLNEKIFLKGKVNEVWAMLMPPSEIARRLSFTYNLSEEEALSATLSMPSNEHYVQTCSRLFSSLWSGEIYDQQIKRAWYEDLERKTKLYFDDSLENGEEDSDEDKVTL